MESASGESLLSRSLAVGTSLWSAIFGASEGDCRTCSGVSFLWPVFEARVSVLCYFRSEFARRLWQFDVSRLVREWAWEFLCWMLLSQRINIRVVRLYHDGVYKFSCC